MNSIPRFLQRIIPSFLPVIKYVIKGNSMFPTLRSGDKIFVNRIAYILSKPKIDDIVAVKDPRDRKVLIKRIKKIDNAKFFILGDNKTHSTDSREFGMIEKKDIIGKIVYKISNI